MKQAGAQKIVEKPKMKEIPKVNETLKVKETPKAKEDLKETKLSVDTSDASLTDTRRTAGMSPKERWQWSYKLVDKVNKNVAARQECIRLLLLLRVFKF